MTIEVRKIHAGEEDAFIRSVLVPFLDPSTGDPESEAEIAFAAANVEADRSWVVDDDGRIVGNCCIDSMDVTVPGSPGQECPLVRMAGVSAVGVHPTHRRRGLLRRMMAEMLADGRDRREPVAGLIASESIIYGRFGFGRATDWATFEIDTRASAFVRPAPALDLQLVDKAEAVRRLPPLFELTRRRRAGEPSRTQAWWDKHMADKPHHRGGGRGAFTAVCDGGYVRYRAHEGNPLQADPGRVVVEELRGVTPEVEAGLWRYVLDLDLVGRVRVLRRPVDDPVRWRLADPRQLRVTSMDDRLHLRILDVTAALERRRYRASGRLVLDLVAPQVEEKDDPAVGVWTLEAGPDGAQCRPARPGEEADLRMEVTDLGTLYLGGFTASAMSAGGRIEEFTAGSLEAADFLFATPLAPFSGTDF
jgi:predicted acetyltransferase